MHSFSLLPSVRFKKKYFFALVALVVFFQIGLNSWTMFQNQPLITYQSTGFADSANYRSTIHIFNPSLESVQTFSMSAINYNGDHTNVFDNGGSLTFNQAGTIQPMATTTITTAGVSTGLDAGTLTLEVSGPLAIWLTVEELDGSQQVIGRTTSRFLDNSYYQGFGNTDKIFPITVIRPVSDDPAVLAGTTWLGIQGQANATISLESFDANTGQSMGTMAINLSAGGGWFGLLTDAFPSLPAGEYIVHCRSQGTDFMAFTTLKSGTGLASYMAQYTGFTNFDSNNALPMVQLEDSSIQSELHVLDNNATVSVSVAGTLFHSNGTESGLDFDNPNPRSAATLHSTSIMPEGQLLLGITWLDINSPPPFPGAQNMAISIAALLGSRGLALVEPTDAYWLTTDGAPRSAARKQPDLSALMQNSQGFSCQSEPFGTKNLLVLDGSEDWAGELAQSGLLVNYQSVDITMVAIAYDSNGTALGFNSFNLDSGTRFIPAADLLGEFPTATSLVFEYGTWPVWPDLNFIRIASDSVDQIKPITSQGRRTYITYAEALNAWNNPLGASCMGCNLNILDLVGHLNRGFQCLP